MFHESLKDINIAERCNALHNRQTSIMKPIENISSSLSPETFFLNIDLFKTFLCFYVLRSCHPLGVGFCDLQLFGLPFDYQSLMPFQNASRSPAIGNLSCPPSLSYCYSLENIINSEFFRFKLYLSDLSPLLILSSSVMFFVVLVLIL